jgi:hypothetical protein
MWNNLRLYLHSRYKLQPKCGFRSANIQPRKAIRHNQAVEFYTRDMKTYFPKINIISSAVVCWKNLLSQFLCKSNANLNLFTLKPIAHSLMDISKSCNQTSNRLNTSVTITVTRHIPADSPMTSATPIGNHFGCSGIIAV